MGSWASTPTPSDRLLGVAERRGWQVSSGSAEFTAAVRILNTLRELGHSEFADRLDEYAAVADRAAATDLDILQQHGDETTMLECLVLSNVLGDRLLATLRKMAVASSLG